MLEEEKNSNKGVTPITSDISTFSCKQFLSDQSIENMPVALSAFENGHINYSNSSNLVPSFSPEPHTKGDPASLFQTVFSEVASNGDLQVAASEITDSEKSSLPVAITSENNTSSLTSQTSTLIPLTKSEAGNENINSIENITVKNKEYKSEDDEINDKEANLEENELSKAPNVCVASLFSLSDNGPNVSKIGDCNTLVDNEVILSDCRSINNIESTIPPTVSNKRLFSVIDKNAIMLTPSSHAAIDNLTNLCSFSEIQNVIQSEHGEINQKLLHFSLNENNLLIAKSCGVTQVTINKTEEIYVPLNNDKIVHSSDNANLDKVDDSIDKQLTLCGETTEKKMSILEDLNKTGNKDQPISSSISSLSISKMKDSQELNINDPMMRSSNNEENLDQVGDSTSLIGKKFFLDGRTTQTNMDVAEKNNTNDDTDKSMCSSTNDMSITNIEDSKESVNQETIPCSSEENINIDKSDNSTGSIDKLPTLRTQTTETSMSIAEDLNKTEDLAQLMCSSTNDMSIINIEDSEESVNNEAMVCSSNDEKNLDQMDYLTNPIDKNLTLYNLTTETDRSIAEDLNETENKDQPISSLINNMSIINMEYTEESVKNATILCVSDDKLNIDKSDNLTGPIDKQPTLCGQTTETSMSIAEDLNKTEEMAQLMCSSTNDMSIINIEDSEESVNNEAMVCSSNDEKNLDQMDYLTNPIDKNLTLYNPTTETDRSIAEDLNETENKDQPISSLINNMSIINMEYTEESVKNATILCVSDDKLNIDKSDNLTGPIDKQPTLCGQTTETSMSISEDLNETEEMAQLMCSLTNDMSIINIQDSEESINNEAMPCSSNDEENRDQIDYSTNQIDKNLTLYNPTTETDRSIAEDLNETENKDQPISSLINNMSIVSLEDTEESVKKETILCSSDDKLNIDKSDNSTGPIDKKPTLCGQKTETNMSISEDVNETEEMAQLMCSSTNDVSISNMEDSGKQIVELLSLYPPHYELSKPAENISSSSLGREFNCEREAENERDVCVSSNKANMRTTEDVNDSSDNNGSDKTIVVIHENKQLFNSINKDSNFPEDVESIPCYSMHELKQNKSEDSNIQIDNEPVICSTNEDNSINITEFPNYQTNQCPLPNAKSLCKAEESIVTKDTANTAKVSNISTEKEKNFSYSSNDLSKIEDIDIPTASETTSCSPNYQMKQISFQNAAEDPQTEANVIVASIDLSETEPKYGESRLLKQHVNNLSSQLLRAQTQLESLLEEKQRWLTATHPPQSQVGINVEKAALVVKFAQSEQMRMKAESRIKELESALNHKAPPSLQTGKFPISMAPSTLAIHQIKELNKALTESREKAEQCRHSLKQEEARVNDLNSKLNAAREAHRNEQKRAAGLTDALNKTSRDISNLRRQLKEADRVREREAKRLCQEVATNELAEKYQKLVTENASLLERINTLEEAAKEHSEVQAKMKELQTSYDALLGVREELEYCQRRETQLSEFTRRLTERNAGLQANHLAGQSRIEATEVAVGEARYAAEDALALAQQAENRLQQEREANSRQTIALEAKLADVSNSEAALRAALATEREERKALKRKQHTLDRELARLMAQARRVSNSVATTAATATPLDRGHEEKEGKIKTVQSTTSLDEPTNPLLSSASPQRFDSLNQVAVNNEMLSKRSPLLIGNTLMSSGVQKPQKHHLAMGYPLSSSQQESQIECPTIQTVEPSKHLLLAKIDKLQRTNVRLMEKIDFMKDHINQLTLELQKKTHILQHHFVNEAEQAGAAAPVNEDENKANVIRRGGGLMASVFAGQAMDGQADLKVSLQINQKLQTVLEDALYKNITLKENVDTLADEVAQLTRANQELKDLVISNTHTDSSSSGKT